MKTHYLYLTSVIVGAAFLFAQCTDEETLNLKSGTLTFKITDAASDDEDIKGIFITVAEVKLDNKPIRNFNPQTIEISDLKNGRTNILVSKELAAKTYKKVSLVLAAATNNQENTPGCYVLTANNSTYNLFSGSNSSSGIEISASKPFEVLPSKENNLVIDFNLRKAIIRNSSGRSGYRFVTQPELENAVRLVNEETSGTIAGSVKTIELESTHIYVFVYKNGEFKASVEGTGIGKSKILFANSITSTKVEPDGSYSLPFIEEGEYDIRLASFKRNRDNIFTFYEFLQTTSRKTGMLLDSVSVSAGTETKLNIEVFSLF